MNHLFDWFLILGVGTALVMVSTAVSALLGLLMGWVSDRDRQPMGIVGEAAASKRHPARLI